MAAKFSVTFATVAIAIPAVAMVMGSTDATIPTGLLTSWAGPGCSGQTATVVSCGCSDLQFYGGHEFHGQTATFYTEIGCTSTDPFQFSGYIQLCGSGPPVWRSINIDC